MDQEPLLSYAPQLSSAQREILQVLLDINQDHIFTNWHPGHLDKVQQFCDHAILLDQKYPGGLKGYYDNSLRLLQESRDGVNPFDGYTPEVPKGHKLSPETSEFIEAEQHAIRDGLGHAAFVLVAGGLGERLGYSGIKISLPVDIVTNKSFIQYYIEYILAFQKRSNPPKGYIPLAIMTSGDTHEKTVALFKDNNYFGLREQQLTIMKQEQVPSIIDNDGRFAVVEGNPYQLETKPHGHGDVHSLVFMEGLTKKWIADGRKWIVFFQDTNGLAFHALPVLLGTSVKHDYDSNTLSVQRAPGEAAGALVKLNKADGSSVTCNVEYNQLDPMLKSCGFEKGDTADESGFSPYPGNTNILVFKLESYSAALEKTKGQVPEFVNPKYSNKERTKFSKPTRLECMMQDFVRLLDSNAKVSFTQFDRWIGFTAVKNNTADAAKRLQSGLTPQSASSCESDMFQVNIKLMRLAGMQIEDAPEVTILGIPVVLGPKVHLSPSFACTFSELKDRIVSGKISSHSTLIVDGDVYIEGLDLDGALHVEAKKDATIRIKNWKVKNDGYTYELLDSNTSSTAPEYLRMRGYSLVKKEIMHEVLEGWIFSQAIA
eukprot:TRINITY_DN2005_c0_g1_i7.p1 TRINITY_DN2005_c0_g1~~TRINITY_DN2005_c0_g1_i7.p1  ORF type:complete len:600 (-),score=144.21 TRINITY_DN2005_c0_g1_i7:541-2340(-)